MGRDPAELAELSSRGGGAGGEQADGEERGAAQGEERGRLRNLRKLTHQRLPVVTGGIVRSRETWYVFSK